MSNDNQIDFTVRIKREGVGELAGDLAKIEDSATDVSAAGADAGASLDKLGDSAQQASAEVGGLAQATAEAADQGGDLGSGTDAAAKSVQELGQDAHQASGGVEQLATAEGRAEDSARDLGAGAQAATKSVAAVGQAASQAGSELDDLRKATDAKTQAVRTGLQVEQSEIELQRQHLAAAAAEQQARLKSAQAQGDETAATRAGNALRQIEADQLRLTAQAKRAEADALQKATAARRELLSAVGPLTAAQQQELQVAENHAKALRVQAAAADQAALRSQELGRSLDDTASRSQALEGTLTQVAKAVSGLFAASKVWDFAKDTIAVADAYGQMAERIQMATGNADEYDLVQRRLLQSANLTYRALSEQQELYIQTADALRSMSYSTADVLDITDSFSYLLTTNAATVERGRNAIDAYTKSIQSGRIEVDAWQSIMAATPTIVDAIARSSGKTAEEVRRLGITGQLSIADLNEGLRQTVELNKEAAAGMSATVKDAVTRLANTWSVYVGEANRAHQSTEKIVWLIDQVSKNLDAVVAIAVTAGEVMVAVWGVKALNALKAYTAQLSLAAAETTALVAATTSAGAKMAAGLAAAGKVAAAGWIGWEIGTFLRSEFDVVEKAGIALAAGLTKAAARAQAAWQMVKAAWSDDTIEQAQERLRAKLQEIDDEYADLFAAADRAAGKQQEVGQKVAAAGAAAQNASVQWERLRKDYELVNKELEAQAAQVEKTATLKNAEAAAAVTMAQALGTETEQRVAQAQAAATQAEQLANIAAQRQIEVNVLIAERDALMAVGEELIRTNPEKKKQLDDLNRQIALRQADAGAALAQAQGAKAAAVAAQAEAEAQKDNAGRVHELRAAYLQAKDALEQVRAAKAAGKATTEDVTKAELAAGRAALLYRDALHDQIKAIEAKRALQQSEIDVQTAGVRLAIEQQKAIAELAKARGNERQAIAAQNEIRRLEIELLRLSAQAKRAEADAAEASAQAKKAELIASGQYNGAKKLEIEAALKAAEVKRLEGQIAETTANKLRDLDTIQRNLKNSTQALTGAIDAQTASLQRRNAELEREIAAQEKANELATRALKLEEAKRNAGTITNVDAVPTFESQEQADAWLAEYRRQYTQKNPFTTRSSGQLGNLGLDMALFEWRAEVDAMRLRNAMKGKGEQPGAAPAPAAQPPAPAPAPAPASKPSGSGGGSSSGASSGATYVSNITLDGRRRTLNYADRQSQLDGDELIRMLAEGKGVAQ